MEQTTTEEAAPKAPKNVSFRPGGKVPATVRREMIALLVAAKKKSYRASLVEQFNAGGAISCPPELKDKLDELNRPYVHPFVARPKAKIPQVW